jgi:hypothetical protein
VSGIARSLATHAVSQEMLTVVADFGFSPVAAEEFPGVHEMASRLMNHDVASVETFLAVQAIQPGSSLAYREDGVVTGVLGVLLLRAGATAQLMNGTFDGVDVDLDLLSGPREVPAIGYGWGVAATTKTAGAAITAVSMPLRKGPLGPFTFVTKAVTPVGRHVSLTRYGYEPLRHPDDDMLISRAERQEAAA